MKAEFPLMCVSGNYCVRSGPGWSLQPGEQAEVQGGNRAADRGSG